MKEGKKIFRIMGAIVVLSAIVMFNWGKLSNYMKNISQTFEKSSVLFSWKIGEETEQKIQSYQKELNIDRVFQYIEPIEFRD